MRLVEYRPPGRAHNALAVFADASGERWTLELVGHRPGGPAGSRVRIEWWRLRPVPAGRPGRPRASAHVREAGPGLDVPFPRDPSAVAAFWFRVLRACREHDGVAEAVMETLL